MEHSLGILFFPLMAPGHMLPCVDLAKLFASRGVKATVLTTPGNARLIQPSIDQANASAGYQHPIQLHIIPFPPVKALPDGCENLSLLPEELHVHIIENLEGLRGSFVGALERLLPDCIITDILFPWTADVASELGMPRVMFQGSSFFAQCVPYSIQRNKILEGLSEAEGSFVVPDLPHRVELRRSVMPDFKKIMPSFPELAQRMKEAESKTYGTVTNSFYDLETDYIDYYRDAMGRKAWAVGPLSLCNVDMAEKSTRGNKTSIGTDLRLKWLDNKSPRSVLYVCLGSMADVTTIQLQEMALGIEASNRPFIWVVRKKGKEWMPQGFEERVKGNGLVIEGWAPQILILNHPSVGGFVTHCGWNSILEGVSMGLPFVTFPLFADEFYNERLIVDILKIGVAVGMDEYGAKPAERKIVEAAAIKTAIKELMGNGEEAEARRTRAKELGESAKRAVDIDGSSYNDLNNLIADLMEMKIEKKK